MRNAVRRGSLLAIALVVGLAAMLGAAERGDILIVDFEGNDYGDWKVEGEAFGPGPARGTLPGQMHVDGFEGKGLVNTFYKGDNTKGTLTSPPLVIGRRYLNFLLGGGMHPGKACIDLLVDGEVVRTATGPNDRPGGSEHLDWHSWDVGDLAGRTAVIRIVDQQTGGWGHINVDHIVQSDRKRMLEPAERTIAVEKRYLHLPVRNGAAKRRMRLLLAAPATQENAKTRAHGPHMLQRKTPMVDGQTVREFEIELADAEPDFWVFCDVSGFAGKPVTIAVDRLRTDSVALEAIKQADEVPDAAGLYREKYRPQFHFSSRRGWNNDPNGLVYYDGEYHLFYQHNPYGWRWGNMHWGHAVSPDLVHWNELPIALYPHRYGDWCFSGSAVVDERNTAGFQTGDEKVIVAAYTSTGRGEAIAFSNDRGRTFTDYEGNPVVEHRGRDPKVIWYGPGEHWVMAVYDERDDSKGVAFYTSPDLKAWQFQSRIDGYFECPELFELAVDGDRADTRWVVYSGNGDYGVGRFDGKTFTAESGKHRFNCGNCFYASQTFNNVPPEDGRRIQIAWGRIGHPDMPFNQMMDFPVELTLRTTDEGIRMFAEPVREIERLYAEKHAWFDVTLAPGKNPLDGITGDLFHVRGDFAAGDAKQLGFNIRGVPVTCDVAKGQLVCQDKTAPCSLVDGRLRLEILVDRTSIEIFAQSGRLYMPMGVIPPDDDRTLEVFAEGGPATIESLEVYELRSAWDRS